MIGILGRTSIALLALSIATAPLAAQADPPAGGRVLVETEMSRNERLTNAAIGVGAVLGGATATVYGGGAIIGGVLADVVGALFLGGTAISSPVVLPLLAVAAGVGAIGYGGYRIYRAIDGTRRVPLAEGSNVSRSSDTRGAVTGLQPAPVPASGGVGASR